LRVSMITIFIEEETHKQIITNHINVMM